MIKTKTAIVMPATRNSCRQCQGSLCFIVISLVERFSAKEASRHLCRIARLSLILLDCFDELILRLRQHDRIDNADHAIGLFDVRYSNGCHVALFVGKRIIVIMFAVSMQPPPTDFTGMRALSSLMILSTALDIASGATTLHLEMVASFSAFSGLISLSKVTAERSRTPRLSARKPQKVRFLQGSTRPAAFTAATKVECPLEFAALSKIFFLGKIAAPPTVGFSANTAVPIRPMLVATAKPMIQARGAEDLEQRNALARGSHDEAESGVVTCRCRVPRRGTAEADIGDYR